MFGENNRQLIGKVIRDGKTLGDDAPGDFLIFLENVVRADAEIEDQDDEAEAATKKAAKKQDRETFFREKYGSGKKADAI